VGHSTSHAMGESHAMELVLMGCICSMQEAAVWDMVRIMNASRILMVNPFADVHIYLRFA